MSDARVRRAFDRAAGTYDGAAAIQRQTLDALLAALPPALPTAAPWIVDIGCGTGLAIPGLAARYPGASIVGIDFSEAMLRRAPHNFQKTVADAARLPLASGVADLAFSSMTWQWCALPDALAEARRILKAGGTLAFSTLLAGTFTELAESFAVVDDHRHTLPLLTEGEVLSAVHAAGFRLLRHERTTRVAEFDELGAALRSIRATGASEVGSQRRPGLLGKAAWRAIETAWKARYGGADRLPLRYEVFEVLAAS